MTFYRSLTPFYDEIFPTNVKALNFLRSNFKQGGLLLDVGAGTGNMALYLAEEGFNVIATEPEKTMAQQIREKATNPSIQVYTKTMQQIEEFEETFDGIYCIGNTLVHLNNVEEINEFLQQVYRKLTDDGLFICQIVNFDKVLSQQDFSFPVIQKETFEFKRQYDLKGDKVAFTTTLTSAGQSFSNTTTLYPATSKQLLPILKNCGFQTIETYGNFEKIPFSVNSPAFILVAKK
ncbi:class I SAM-dependent methyltransferase [Neobacillus sp. FSL H8-0543]|uniref:class I SAM-dependent methyltransferase n=1 Tax=Neobacillus sp. FSL H8-0543 TaxID=2954672 RepID=UPI0031597BE4